MLWLVLLNIKLARMALANLRACKGLQQISAVVHHLLQLT